TSSPLARLLACAAIGLPTIFFFPDPATRELYTLSLHDALPISCWTPRPSASVGTCTDEGGNSIQAATRSSRRHGFTGEGAPPVRDRKSTRLNSSHVKISYAVFCLKKKKRQDTKSCAPASAKLAA